MSQRRHCTNVIEQIITKGQMRTILFVLTTKTTVKVSDETFTFLSRSLTSLNVHQRTTQLTNDLEVVEHDAWPSREQMEQHHAMVRAIQRDQ